MTIDRSLKSRSLLKRHRNVLKRDERIAALKDAEKWNEDKSIFGLPKVRTIKPRRRGKAKATPKPGAEAVVAEAAAPVKDEKAAVKEKPGKEKSAK